MGRSPRTALVGQSPTLLTYLNQALGPKYRSFIQPSDLLSFLFLLPPIDLSANSITPVEMAANPTAMMLAWEEAFKNFKASMPAKDLKHIQQPTAPGDIISHLNKWMSSKETTSGKLASLLQDRTARLQRFAGAIDQLAQGMPQLAQGMPQLAQGIPQPASLIWGSIRFVLTVRSIFMRV
jgi:X-X-X-Leu-X-X-Gly heptad repeat protein